MLHVRLSEAHTKCWGVYSCSERLPIFQSVHDLIGHMLILSEWYLCLSQYFLSWAQHVLLLHACGSGLTARQRFKQQLEMANCCHGLPYIWSEQMLHVCVCVYKGHRDLNFLYVLKYYVSLRESIEIVWRTKRKRFMGLVTSHLVCTPGRHELSLTRWLIPQSWAR